MFGLIIAFSFRIYIVDFMGKKTVFRENDERRRTKTKIRKTRFNASSLMHSIKALLFHSVSATNHYLG